MNEDERQKRHREGRGKKLPTLADLSKEMPSEEQLIHYMSLLHKESDRGAAVMASALVEMALGVAIRSRIADPGETTTKVWFEGPNAPFGTFSAKIKLGRALAIYGPQMEGRLNAIKEIRNAFAHRALPLDFDHPTVREACLRMAPFVPRKNEEKMRIIFITGCHAQTVALITYAFDEGGKELEIKYP